jgi:hypothetical protein
VQLSDVRGMTGMIESARIANTIAASTVRSGDNSCDLEEHGVSHTETVLQETRPIMAEAARAELLRLSRLGTSER